MSIIAEYPKSRASGSGRLISHALSEPWCIIINCAWRLCFKHCTAGTHTRSRINSGVLAQKEYMYRPIGSERVVLVSPDGREGVMLPICITLSARVGAHIAQWFESSFEGGMCESTRLYACVHTCAKACLNALCILAAHNLCVQTGGRD